MWCSRVARRQRAASQDADVIEFHPSFDRCGRPVSWRECDLIHRELGGGAGSGLVVGEPVCRRDSVPGSLAGVPFGDHPSVRPTRGCLGRSGELLGGRAARAHCSALLRVGVTQPPRSLPTLVRSYRTVSPLPVPAPRGVRAIGGLLSVALYRQIAPTWLSPAPCSVESRPSSTPRSEVQRRGHPTDSPTPTVSHPA